MPKLSQIVLFAVLVLASSQLTLAQSNPTPVYKRGETIMESTLPPSPEAAAKVRYVDVPFSYNQGLAEYEVPFSTLRGRELSIPVSLRYRSGGIKLDETAGVAGLGWTLEVGGCITRTVMDMPDEFSDIYMEHQLPFGELLDSLEQNYNSNDVNSPAHTYLSRLIWHQIDAQLDRYNYNVCGLCGSFVITDDGTVVQLSGEGVEIDYQTDDSGAPGTFTIVGPEGTVYELSAKEIGEHDGSIGQPPIVPVSHADKWEATTAWYLTRIVSRSGLESATFSYESAGNWVRDMQPASWTFTTVFSPAAGTTSYPETSFWRDTQTIRHSYNVLKLKTVTLGQFTLNFSYAGNTGSDNHLSGINNFPVRLTGIAMVHPAEGTLDSLAVGTSRHSMDGRIMLNSISRFRKGMLDDQWTFDYYERGQSVCQGSQDWYGYYNSSYEPEHHFVGQILQTSTNICPYEMSSTGTISARSHAMPHAEWANYLSLRCADHDGARTVYEYEGNVRNLAFTSTSIGVRVKNITVSDLDHVLKIRSFVYDSLYVDGPILPNENMYITVEAPNDINGSLSRTWTTTLHETPVVVGPSIRDSKVYYGKVTETSSNARTEYRFMVDKPRGWAADPSSRFPESAADEYDELNQNNANFNPWLGVRGSYLGPGPASSPLLVSKKEFSKSENGVWRLLSSDENTYESDTTRTLVLISYIAHRVNRHGIAYGEISPQDIYHYPVRAEAVRERRPSSTLHVEYHEHGNDSCRVNVQYMPRLSLAEPNRIASINMQEGGVERRLEYRYPDNYDDNSVSVRPWPPVALPWTVTLKNQHFLSVPIQKNYYVSPVGQPSSTPLYSELTRYGEFWIQRFGMMAQEVLLPKYHIESYLGSECWRETIRSRDSHGNVSSVKETGSPITDIVWDNSGLYPIQITQDTLLQTFTFRPGIGLASSIDASGVETKYDYDYAGRLTAIKDGYDRPMEIWEYNIFNGSGDGRLSRIHKKFRTTNGNQYAEDVTWWNTLGMHLQDIIAGGSGDGRDLVWAYGADSLLHDDARSWLPYPVADSGMEFQEDAEQAAAAFHGSDLAYKSKKYELSMRDSVIAVALPGYAGLHETSYKNDVCDSSFPHYVWYDNTGVIQDGCFSPGEVVAHIVTDADGRTDITYTDHAGRTLAHRLGTDAPTYYIYDGYDQLRAVAGGGIGPSDTLSMWRYTYDALGRLSSKGIPGCTREHYGYDDENRIISVRQGEYFKENEYDALGRLTASYLTEGSHPQRLLESHSYCYDKESSARYAVLTQNPSDTSSICATYNYDDRGRLVQTVISYPGNETLSETTEYDFAGDIVCVTTTCSRGGQSRTQTISTTRDNLGRPTNNTSSLKRGMLNLAAATSSYSYDEIGRANGKTLSCVNGTSLSITDNFELQGWLSSRVVKKNGESYFAEYLGYSDFDLFHGIRPSYTGLVTSKSSRWTYNGHTQLRIPDYYAYDASGRLSQELADGRSTVFVYDDRSNILSESVCSQSDTVIIESIYNGDRLQSRGNNNFAYDIYGRMTYDGLAGLNIAYNALDLPQTISGTDGNEVCFSYSANGIKLGEYRGDGSGLEFRGPFVYRRDADGSTNLESVACPEGRLTPSGALFQVKDYLGSVRAVIDAQSGITYESSDYTVYGTRVPRVSSTLPGGITLREHFTGCEDLDPDFALPYAHHRARFYAHELKSWMAPDPMSEYYFGTSPYSYCGGNPLGGIDPNGNTDYIVNGKRVSIDDGRDETVELHGATFLLLSRLSPSGKTYWRIRQAVMDKNGYMTEDGEAVLPAAFCFPDAEYPAASAYGGVLVSGTEKVTSDYGKFLYNIKNGTWHGQNGVEYDINGPFNGNQYTGGKYRFARRNSMILKTASHSLSAVQIGIDARSLLSSETFSERVSAGMNIMFDIVGVSSVGAWVSMAWSAVGEFYFNQYIIPYISLYFDE